MISAAAPFIFQFIFAMVSYLFLNYDSNVLMHIYALGDHKLGPVELLQWLQGQR